MITEILFPYKHWCGSTIEDKLDQEFHDCDNWAHVLKEEQDELHG